MKIPLKFGHWGVAVCPVSKANITESKCGFHRRCEDSVVEEGEETMFRAVKVGNVHRIDSTKDKLKVFRSDLLKIILYLS